MDQSVHGSDRCRRSDDRSHAARDAPVPVRFRPPRARPLGRRRVHRTSAPRTSFVTGPISRTSCRSTATSRASSSRRVPSSASARFVTGRPARRAHLARRARGRRLSVRTPDGPRRRRRLVRESEGLRGVVRSPRRRRTHVRLRRGLDQDPRRRRHRASSRRRRSRSRFTDNPNLKPERSRSFDLGIEQALAGAALDRWTLTWFSNSYDDLIVAVPHRDRRCQPRTARTTSPTRARAGSSSARARASHGGVAVRGSWTWLDTEVLGVDGCRRSRRRRTGRRSAVSAGRRSRARST